MARLSHAEWRGLSQPEAKRAIAIGGVPARGGRQRLIERRVDVDENGVDSIGLERRTPAGPKPGDCHEIVPHGLGIRIGAAVEKDADVPTSDGLSAPCEVRAEEPVLAGNRRQRGERARTRVVWDTLALADEYHCDDAGESDRKAR